MFLRITLLGRAEVALKPGSLTPNPPLNIMLSCIITLNPIPMASTSGPKRREACWQGSVDRDVCVWIGLGREYF